VDAVLADLAEGARVGAGPDWFLRRLAAPTGSSAEIDLAELTRRLGGADAVMWGTIQLRLTIYWYVLDGGGCRAGRLDAADGSPLATALGDLAAALPDRDEYAERVAQGATVMADGAGRTLAALLLPAALRQRWRQAASDGRPHRLLIVPAAAVARHPLGALPLGAGGEPLAQWLTPVYVPSPALAWTAGPRIPAGNPSTSPSPRSVALVVADPTGDLPGAAARPAGISPVRRAGRSTRRPPARRDRQTSDGLATWVYAGHTTALGDGVSPALRLADAEVTAAEWLTSGGRSRLPAPRRVVLVSCSSAGLGPVDWYGLATAALCAGATTVVCSLWPHPDALWSVDRQVVTAVAQAGDVAAAVHGTLARLRLPGGSPPATSPFVWGNYVVISHEPAERMMIDHPGRDG
jgi:hypothetical protein